MDGWRISKRRYANPPAAAFDGEGSRRRGGRWTPPGKRVAYASSSLALASLEYFVNLDPQDAPSGLVSVHTSIPDGIRCERVNISSLPESWRGVPFPQELWAVGRVGWWRAHQSASWCPRRWSRRSSTCLSTRCIRLSRFCGSRTHRCSTSIRGCGSDHRSIPCIQHPTRRTMKAAEDALL